ncbi:MAG: hypothetical protein NTU60_13005 [Candidatus Aminicenantes bacterium]|nr:hypothetical protein [Candidatus Aminicenantes bacterium]
MKDIFDIIIKKDLIVLDGEGGLRRRAAGEGRDLDWGRRIKQGMEGAGDLVQMLVAEKIVGDDGPSEEQDQQN